MSFHVHVAEGFPHLNSRTGACMCSSSCCTGTSGCMCGACSGVGHVGCPAARAAHAAGQEPVARRAGRTRRADADE